MSVTDGSCTNRICKIIEIFSEDPCTNTDLPECEYLLNGDFSQNTIPIGDPLHYGDPNTDNECTPQNSYCADFVCNWNNKYNSPYFCSNFESSMVLGSGFTESIVTQTPLDLVDSETYTISFEYYVNVNPFQSPNFGPTLDIGFSNSNSKGRELQGDTVIASLINLPYDDFEGANIKCHPQDTSFHFYEMNFKKNPTWGNFLYFEGNDSYASDYIFIKNINISKCQDCLPIPQIQVEIDDCIANFIGSNTGDAGTYLWDFGDGSTSQDSIVEHEYLFDGEFNVCLTISCLEDTELSSTICEKIIINSNCTNCDSIDLVTSLLCYPLKGQNDIYLANFEFPVAKGSEPCNSDSLFMVSYEMDIEVTSFYIDETDPNFDIVHAAIEATQPFGYDFESNGATVYLTLCDSSETMFCYIFELEGETCDDCMTIFSDAICNQSLSTDSTFIYEGSVLIENVQNFTELEIITNNLNLNINLVPIALGQYQINYTLSTTLHEEFEAVALISFEAFDKQCFTINIKVDDLCPILPIECEKQWATKSMSCKEVKGEDIIFNFQMDVSISGHSICPEGLFGTIDDGIVVINSYTQTINYVSFDLDLILPSGYDQNLIYDLRVYFCNGNNEYVCYLFPLNLNCSIDNGGGSDTHGSGDSFYTSNNINSGYSIIPNPASEQVIIKTHDWKMKKNHQIEIIDQSGRIISHHSFLENQIILSLETYQAGIYYVRIFENKIPILIDRIVIIK